jgi:hypothetical protein
MWIAVTRVSGGQIMLNMSLAYRLEPRADGSKGTQIFFMQGVGATTVEETIAEILALMQV